jgi:hypothetical protein
MNKDKKFPGPIGQVNAIQTEYAVPSSPNPLHHPHTTSSNIASGRSSKAFLHTEGNDFSSDPLEEDLLAMTRLDSASEPRVCSMKICRTPLPTAIHYPYKMCGKCREKSRENGRKRTARLKGQAGQALLSSHAEDAVIAGSHLTPKERFKDRMSQLRIQGKLQSASLGRRKVQGNFPIADDHNHSSMKPMAEPIDREYQDALHLYDTLWEKNQPVYLHRIDAKNPKPKTLANFGGYFCIAQDLLEPITQERISQEVSRVEKLAGIPVRLVMPLYCPFFELLICYFVLVKVSHPEESSFRWKVRLATGHAINANALGPELSVEVMS